MHRSIGVILFLAALATPLSGADTFASRFESVKHVGLAVDAELHAITLHVYTPERFGEHTNSLEAFRKERDEFNERLRGYERERRKARELRATPSELNRITEKRNRDVANQPTSPFEKRVKLHTVLRVGADYISLSPLDAPNDIVLIPFNRIGRVIYDNTKKSGEPSDAPKSASQDVSKIEDQPRGLGDR